MKTIAKATVIAVALSLLTAPSYGQGQTASDQPPPKPRIATVDMKKLFNEYHKTAEAQKEFDADRAQIQKEDSERMAHIRDVMTEGNKLDSQRQDPTLPESRRQELFKDFLAKRNEHHDLERKRQDFLERRNQQFNERMLQRTKSISGDFIKPIEKLATTGNYDYIYSGSQNIASTEPEFLAYTGDPSSNNDITDLILKEVNRDVPADSRARKDSQSAPSPTAPSNRVRTGESLHPKLKIAKVDMARLIRMYHETSKIEKQIDLERSRVKKSDEEDKAKIQNIETTLANLRKQLENTTLSVSEKQTLLSEKQFQEQASMELDARRSYSLKRRTQALDEKARQRMKSISEMIQKIVIEHCKAEGFDFVADRFNESVTTNSAFLISTALKTHDFNQMTDVTDIMLQQINKDAPAGFQPPK